MTGPVGAPEVIANGAANADVSTNGLVIVRLSGLAVDVVSPLQQ